MYRSFILGPMNGSLTLKEGPALPYGTFLTVIYWGFPVLISSNVRSERLRRGENDCSAAVRDDYIGQLAVPLGQIFHIFEVIGDQIDLLLRLALKVDDVFQPEIALVVGDGGLLDLEAQRPCHLD